MTDYEKDYHMINNTIQFDLKHADSFTVAEDVNDFVSEHRDLKKDFHAFTDPNTPIGIIM